MLIGMLENFQLNWVLQIDRFSTWTAKIIVEIRSVRGQRSSGDVRWLEWMIVQTMRIIARLIVDAK